MHPRMKQLAFGLGLAALLSVSATGAAAQPYRQQVIAQLERLGGTQVRAHQPYLNAMRQGAAETVELTLRAGVSYEIWGACDQDCRDLDLALDDENGNRIDADFASDDIPVVRVTPQWTGTFRVRASMAHCSTSVCYWGIQSFQR